VSDSERRREFKARHLPVAPCAWICQERICDSGGERTGWSCHQVAVRIGNVSPSHWHDLRDDPEERLLESNADANEDLTDDKSVDVFGNSTDDAANESDTATDDEEPCRRLSVEHVRWSVCTRRNIPSSSENIGELTDH
jgi:hypothetical protein